MANTSQARKRIRQNEKRRQRNLALRSKLRTHLKRVTYALADGALEKAESAYKLAVPVIDSVAGKGIIHKNKAARHKSRLNSKIKALKLAAAS